MSFYFQYNVDQKSLFDFLGFFGLASDIDEAYSVGYSMFNMVSAVVQFLGVIFLSRFLANKYGKRKVFIVCLPCQVRHMHPLRTVPN